MHVSSSRCRIEGQAHSSDPDRVCVFKRATCMNHKVVQSLGAASARTSSANDGLIQRHLEQLLQPGHRARSDELSKT